MKTCNQCGELNINYQTEPVATWSIHDNCTQCTIDEYVAYRGTYGYSQEERAEMAAAFGPDANIIDVLTGEKVLL